MDDMPAPIPFRVTTAGGAGLTRAQTRGARFRTPSRGVRVLSASAPDVALRAATGVVGSKDGAVLTDIVAAHSYGMPIPAWLQDVPKISVAVLPDQAKPRRRDVRGRRLRLPEEHVTVRDGVRITTPARTWLDCAAFIPLEHVVAMGDAALRTRLVTLDELKRMTHWGYRRRGVGVARRALPLLDPRSESPGESLIRVLLMLGGAPRPVCNHQVTVRGEWLARVDLAWPEFKVAVEYDGIVHLPEDARRYDARRRNQLQEMGWIVITATADDVRRPEQILHQVKAALRSRGWAPTSR